MWRRDFLKTLAASAAIIPARAWGQAYPARPIRLVVGYAAGGANDIIGRLMGQSLSERLGQPFVVENRPGAATNIATEAVARAEADGYTLLMASAANAINATLYEKLSFDFIRDFAPVAGIARVANVMLVHPSLPVATVPELIAYARANPGKISMASSGVGSPQHLAGELFKMMTGTEMLHVPYRGGGPALTDLMAGQVQLSFATTALSAGYVKAGKVRALGVTSLARWEALPEVPAIADFIPGYEVSSWFGIAAPKATPAEVIGILNSHVNAVLADAKFNGRLLDIGATAIPGTPDDFRRLIADEIQKWAKVVKFSGAKAS